MHQALIAQVAVEAIMFQTVFLINVPYLLGELWGEC